jgi:hypothetical protein
LAERDARERPGRLRAADTFPLEEIKNRGSGRDFYSKWRGLRRRFAEGLDALGAQCLLDETTLFHHAYLLQVRFELAVGGALGEGSVVSEGGCLAAVAALSHL